MPSPDHDPSRYGRSFADVYDEWYSSSFDTGATVEAIIGLAHGGSVLELGAGTGRLALPLADAGLDLVALDSSTAMLDRLRARDAAGRISIVTGDMAAIDELSEVRARRFDVVVCACSSLLNLPDRRSIGRCLAGARSVLRPGGAVVIETVVPAEDPPAHSLVPARVESDAAVFVETHLDSLTGRVDGRHIEIGGGRVRVRPWSVVLLSPVELDSLAAGAGLRLRSRWADWSGAPFDEDCGSQVSIHESDA